MVEMIADRRFLFEGAMLHPGAPLTVREDVALIYERRRMASRVAEPTQAPDWFPDWRGQTVVVVGAGPGVVDLAPAQGRAKVIAVNRSIELCPWADVLYACDEAFWDKIAPAFDGLKITQSEPAAARYGLRRVKLGADRISTTPGVIGGGGNSGFQAINLAVQFGVKRIVLVGFDMTMAQGLHWHGAHSRGMNNPTRASLSRWRRGLDAQADRFRQLGVQVINATPGSALLAYPFMTLQEALDAPLDAPLDAAALSPPAARAAARLSGPGQRLRPLLIEGMHGLGDNLHQRAIVRELGKDREVWVETPWPSVYHDLGVRLVTKGSSLRTQAKNARRERAAYSATRAPVTAERMTISYPPQSVRDHGSVLAGMSATAGVPAGDFRMPVAPDWKRRAQTWLDRWSPTKPLMIYRPLVERSEWSGCPARNPDHDHYADLFESIRDQFFVVSVADLVPGKEWLVGRRVTADAECHAGELEFEVLAALTEAAGLVFTAPGFAAVLGQAVGAPVVAVFGGYENSASFSSGARFSPYLGIDPVQSCQCFRHDHDCRKAIDMPAARRALAKFVKANPVRVPESYVLGGRSKVRPNVAIAARPADLSGLPDRFMNPGELETLVTLVGGVAPRTVIEIGVNSGRTAKAILRNVPSIERYVGIDVPPSYAFAKRVQRNEVPPKPGELALDDPRFRLMLVRRGTFDLTPNDLPQADVVFIDGDHGAEAVRNDHALAKALVRPGGLIIHHDDHDLGNVDVRDVLDDLHTETAPISHVLGTWLAFERVPA